MLKKLSILVFLMVVLAASPLFAQNSSTHSVTVTLQDATNDEPVGFATVSVTLKGSDTPAKYTITNEKGSATLDGLKNGTYTFAAELMGYKKYTQEITVKDGNVAIGTVKMDVDQETLDAANVSAIGNPVIIKKDTIEYTAAAFKTTENDVLEDLLKKLPGVEVDNGTVTVNGQTVTRVYIDGKTFFMDDPQLATKNIPAKIINKVKVVQKKSEQAEFTGIDDGQEETVLDLSVQPGMMNGLMGNLQAGLGHDLPKPEDKTAYNDDYRFNSQLFLGNFTGDTQISIIGNANNANNRGFGDRMGGMMGGGGGMMGGMGGGGGITTSYMAGVNLGSNFFDDRMELTGDYMFSGSNNVGNTDQYNETVVRGADYRQASNSNTSSTRNSYDNRVGLRIEHEFSKSANIIFEPQISYGWGDNSSLQLSNTSHLFSDGTSMLTNDGFSSNIGNSKNLNASGMFMYRQRLGLPGRTLTSRINFSFSNTDTDGFVQSLNNIYRNLPDGTAANESLITNQRTEQGNKNTSINANVTYTEPMGNFFYIEANYQYSYRRQNSTKNAFNSGAVDIFDVNHIIYNPVGEVFDIDYSNNIVNESSDHNIGANMLYQNDKLRAQIGATLRPQTTHNVTDRADFKVDTTFTVVNWSPNAMIMWDANDYLNLRFFYRGNSSQPSVSQLMPVPDNSNPMSVSLGNPSLAPYFSHNVNGEFRYTNRQKFASMNLRFNAGVTQNPIVNATWFDTNNVRYSMPFNGKNTSNGSLNFTANFPIFVQNLTLSTTTSVNGNQSFSYQGGNQIDVSKYYKDGNKSNFDYPLFLADYSDISNSKDFIVGKTQTLGGSERLNLQFRTDDIEIRVGGSTNVSKSWISTDNSSTPYTWRNAVNASFTWTWDITGMSLRTDANYNWYTNYTTDVEPECIINAEITKMIFKQRATIALRGSDLLAQSKSFSYSVDADGNIRESTSNILGRYIIFSFTYRFGTFGGGRGRGGHGGGMPMGGGMPPMGGGRGGRF